MTREMPATRGAERFKKLLGILWIASIIGLTLSVSGLFETLLEATYDPAYVLRRRVLKYTLMICESCIIAWISYRGTRRNIAPSEWLILLVSVIACAVAFI